MQSDEVLLDTAIRSLTVLLSVLKEMKNSSGRRSADDLLSQEEVAQALRISLRTLQRQIKNNPAFPAPFSMENSRLKKWRRSDITAYIDSLRESSQACKALNL